MRKLSVLLVLIAVTMLTASVYAVGGSSGGSSSPPPAPTPSPPAPAQQNNTPPAQNVQQVPTCESLNLLTDRIKCRLENRTVGLNITEESCRTAPNAAACKTLYANVEPCYDVSGAPKDQCFKRIAGFSKTTVAAEKNTASVRNYLVFLLYDLQEKTEASYNAGKISSTDASRVISLIVEIKGDIMNGKPKTVIKPKISSLNEQVRGLSI